MNKVKKFWLQRPSYVNYLLAAGLSAIATGLHFQLRTLEVHEHPILFLVITISVFCGGWGPGIFAAVLTSLANLYYFIPPYDSWALTTPGDIGDFVLFTSSAIALSVMTASLNSARSKALAFAKQRSDFAARVGHELRTPLVGILGLSRNLSQSQRLSAEEKVLAEQIHRSGQGLLSIVSELLTFSHLENSQGQPEIAAFNLHQELDLIFELMKLPFLEKGIALRWPNYEILPVKLKGPQLALRQILMNLLSNALKFTEHGSVHLEIQIARHSSNSLQMKFQITDTGIGIPECKLNVIFEPYRQVHEGLDRKYLGTGLGLSIVNELTQSCKGKVGVSSQPGQGSQFWVELPMSELQENDSFASANTARTAPQIQLQKRVLIVDDNEVNRLVLKLELEQFNLQVDLAEDGEQAVQALRQKHYDLIFLDFQMPSMDGFETLQKLRTLAEKTPRKFFCVAFTALETEGLKSASRKNWIQAILPKPWTEPQLHESIEHQLHFDPKPLYKLWKHSGQDTPMIETLVHSFVKNTQERLLGLQAAILDPSQQDIQKAIHNLEGPCSLMGVHSMLTTCWNFNSDPQAYLIRLFAEFESAKDQLFSQLQIFKDFAKSKDFSPQPQDLSV
jgi:signal transduction histidine kinase/CheY-like chemotaxis protein